MLPIPKKLLKQGVRDMVRLSDARMSGTSYGCCILHVAPESFVGGPLALVRTGDVIALDIPARTLTLQVDEAELTRRRSAWRPPAPRYERGHGAMFARPTPPLGARPGRHLRPPHHAGRQGLRLRLPGRHLPHPRPRDSLNAHHQLTSATGAASYLPLTRHGVRTGL